MSPTLTAPYMADSLYAQILKDELVLPMYRYPAEDLKMLQYVDLKTGKVRYSDPTSVFPGRGFVSDGKTLWSLGFEDDIYETDGRDVKTYTTKSRLKAKAPLVRAGFLYEGRPAIIDRDDEQQIHRLMVLIDGDWIEEAQVAIPGANRVQASDPQSIRSVLVTRYSEETSKEPPKWPRTQIVKSDDEYHLIQFEMIPVDIQSTTPCRIRLLHRIGFDFTNGDLASEPVSAMTPANDYADTIDWNFTEFLSENWFRDLTAHQGSLFFVNLSGLSTQRNVVSRFPSYQSQRPETVQVFESLIQCTLQLISTADSKELYLLEQPRLGESTLYRWNGTQFERLPILIEGISTVLVRRVAGILARILAVLWIGSWLSVLCANWLTKRTGDSEYSFGTETVRLASVARRAIARTIDIGLILIPLIAVIPTDLVHQNSELTFRMLLTDRFFVDMNRISSPMIIATGWACAIWISFVVCTARTGTSPGKWICRIRVVRTTLRPCGFARSLVRELVFWFDMPLLLTAIPGLIWIVVTRYRQRLGDLVADTIVIDATCSNELQC